MPLDLILPKKFASNMVKWTMLRKNTPNTMRYNSIIYTFSKKENIHENSFIFGFFAKNLFGFFS